MAIKTQEVVFECDATGRKARLIIGGVDMTSQVGAIRIEAEVGVLTQVWVRFAAPIVRANLMASEWVRYEAQPEPEAAE